MKKLLLSTALAVLLPATGAFAGGANTAIQIDPAHPAIFLGIAVEFGDSVKNSDVGLTAKVVSSNRPNQFVVGAGVGYFPWSDQPFGVDVDAGYNFSNFGLLGGYDLVRQKPQVSLGWVPTSDGKHCPANFPYMFDGACYSSPPPSDRRLKRDIVYLGTLIDGIRIYSFRYLWSEEVYVGVMAQDLLEEGRWQHAVITDVDGYYSVDYGALDLAMVHWDVWKRYGLGAMVLGSRPAEFMVAAA